MDCFCCDDRGVFDPDLSVPSYINSFSTYVISTGSMEPTIPAGTVAITRPLEATDVREEMIISFASPVDVDTTIMHRVTEVRDDNGSLSFRTKGDNNNAEDNWIVQPDYIKGELVYQIPYIGHLVAFVQTPLGFGIAIGIPALLLVLAQIRRIKQGIEEEVEKRLKKAAEKTQTVSGVLILFVMANAMLAVVSIKTMYAWFTTSAQVHGIMISIKDFVPPPVPAHSAPTDGSILQSTSILFDWSDEEDYEDHNNPVYYILQLGADSGFSTIVYTSSELSASETLPPGIGDGTYFWRVKACDAIDNCSDWSIGWEITIDDTPPSTPIWIRPADGSATRQSQHMLFDWTNSNDANLMGYEYENRKGAAAPWRSIDTCGLLTESQIPNTQIGPTGSCILANAATLSSDGQYFRRVRAVDAAGNYSGWSDEWMIHKDATKPTSSVIAFTSTSTTSTTIDVYYTSSDVGAGVKEVELFYRFEDGPWTSYGSFTPLQYPISFIIPNPSASGSYDFYTLAEDKADDLSTTDMADGSAGDDGLGNIEIKAPTVEASIEYVAPVSGPLPGDVVINEIMWMGTVGANGSTADEWIELRNMTTSEIDITGWEIEGAGSGSSSIELSGSISAHGFFLLSNYVPTSSALGDTVIVDQVTASVSLDNSGEVLILKNGSTVIDQTPPGTWAAGINSTTKHSMERNSIPGDGTLPTSWHSCISAGCNDSPFWDTHNGPDNGTPRATNLSENDLSLRLAFPLLPVVVGTEAYVVPSVQMNLREDRLAVGFSADDISNYDTLHYELSYDSATGLQGAMGTVEIGNQHTITRENILLGSCSTGGKVCTYHTGITSISLTITLIHGSEQHIITQQLSYE